MQIPLDWYRNGWVSQPFPAQAFKHGGGVFDKQSGLLQGTVELLVLKTLSWGPAHGYDVARWIQEVTGDALRVEEGSLYPALHRLKKRKLLKSSWGLSRNNRRAKYYEITAKGREALAREASTWSSFTNAVTTVMTSSDRPAWAK